MPTFTATQQIAAPAHLVWDRIADVMAWPEWLPTVVRVEAMSSGSLAVGSSFRVLQPRLRPATWTVSQLIPGSSFAWESSSPGLRMRANHTVEASSHGGSLIRLEFQFSGALAPAVAWLLGGLTRRYLVTEAESLRAHAEADARAKP
ncbi:MAG: SRPBCC family protein [Rubrivivax sp.]|nr:SRPBCC family protein [Rubrivivax sp.]